RHAAAGRAARRGSATGVESWGCSAGLPRAAGSRQPEEDCVKTCASEAVPEVLPAGPGVLLPRDDGGASGAPTPLAAAWVRPESNFYLGDRWCLNAFPTIREMVGRLHRELRR